MTPEVYPRIATNHFGKQCCFVHGIASSKQPTEVADSIVNGPVSDLSIGRITLDLQMVQVGCFDIVCA